MMAQSQFCMFILIHPQWYKGCKKTIVRCKTVHEITESRVDSTQTRFSLWLESTRCLCRWNAIWCLRFQLQGACGRRRSWE